jgi:hypothetical protein
MEMPFSPAFSLMAVSASRRRELAARVPAAREKAASRREREGDMVGNREVRRG